MTKIDTIFLITFEAGHTYMADISILLDVLLCSIAEYFYELCRVKILSDTTQQQNIQ